MRADRVLLGLAGRCLLLAAVVLLATVPVYVYVEPGWRPLVGRLAAAFVVGVCILSFRRALVERLALDGPSPLDEVRGRRAPEPGVPHHFRDLVSDVRAALRSRRYFEEGLWPRLVGHASRPLVRPPARVGRGPSLADLRAALDAIEKPR
jgi:hypothetical protein